MIWIDVWAKSQKLGTMLDATETGVQVWTGPALEEGDWEPARLAWRLARDVNRTFPAEVLAMERLVALLAQLPEGAKVKVRYRTEGASAGRFLANQMLSVWP